MDHVSGIPQDLGLAGIYIHDKENKSLIPIHIIHQ